MKTINNELQYLHLLDKVLEKGEERGDRTDTGTLSLFGEKMKFNLQEGFPLLTTKKTWFHGIKGELLWFIRGDTNIKWLHENNIHFWDDWADENGDLGPIYGEQLRGDKRSSLWRTRRTFDPKTHKYRDETTKVYKLEECNDQLRNVINSIKTNPSSRRHIISLWNHLDLDKMNLPPCHGVAIQFYVREDKYLDCQMYQRSGDMFLGVPFNIASYSLLTHMVAQVAGYKAGKFIHILGDAHIYKNHIDQVKKQLSRSPYDPPELVLNPSVSDIDEFVMDDIGIENYEHHDAIKAPVAV